MTVKRQAIRINQLYKIKKKLSHQAKTAFQQDDIICSYHKDHRNSIPVITAHKGGAMYSYSIGRDLNTSDRSTMYKVYFKLAQSKIIINPSEKELQKWLLKVTGFQLKNAQRESYLNKYRILKREENDT